MRAAFGALAVGLAACTSFHELVGDAGVRDAARPSDASDATVTEDVPTIVLPKDAGHDATTPSPFTLVQGFPQADSLLAVWGSDPDDVFAVGTNGLHCDYYQAAWNCSNDVLGRTYYAVWGTSESDVYAVGTVGGDGGPGTTGIVEHFNGTGWTDAFLCPTPLYGVWGAGVGQVLAVGSGGHIYGVSPGSSTWGSLGTMPANPNVPVTSESPLLFGVSGANVNDFEIAAGQDRIFQYVGNDNFANLDPAPDRTLDFRAVWAVPGTAATAFFGTNYFGVSFLTGSGPPDAAAEAQNLYRIFEDQGTPGADGLYIWSIWGTSSQTVFVGDLGRIYAFNAGTTDFAPLPSPTNQALYGVWGSSLRDVWIVGQNELILHGSIATQP